VVVRDEHPYLPRHLLLDCCTCHLLCATFSHLILNKVLCPSSVTNTFFTAYLPISSYLSFDNTGSPYQPTAIVTDGVFDVDKYRGYSPVYLSATLVIAYGVAFAAFSSVFVHTFCEYDLERALPRYLTIHSVVQT
jgi:hypothetical protein